MGTSPGVTNPTEKNPPPSEIQTRPNLVAFDPKAVVPSQPIYVQRNDYLGFSFYTNAVGVTFRLNYRWLTPDGEIKEGEYDSPPCTWAFYASFPIYEGWLLSFGARVTSSVAAGQWNYLVSFVTRSGVQSSAFPGQGLYWQGFLYNNTQNGWPGTPTKEITDGPGTLRLITGSQPGAGAEINETLPSQRRWSLIAFNAGLTTSASVANRQPALRLFDGASTYLASRSSTLQAASTTFGYNWAPGLPFATDGLTGANLLLAMPTPTLLKFGLSLSTLTAGIQAGDQWTAPKYLILEWGQWDN